MPDMGDEMGPVLETGLSQENVSTPTSPDSDASHPPIHPKSWMLRSQELPESSTHTHTCPVPPSFFFPKQSTQSNAWRTESLDRYGSEHFHFQPCHSLSL